MISPEEMACIYWTHAKASAIFQVELLLKNLSPTSEATDYWHQVWKYLTARKERKGMIH